MNKENLSDRITEEINRELDELDDLDLGSEEHSTAVKDVAELYRLNLEKQKSDNDLLEKESKKKSDRLKDIFSFVLAAAGLIIPQIFYSVWMTKGLEFEEKGTFTSQTFKGLIREFKPFKK
ncbi:MAG: hypothetical protein NC120_12350 [Ruminococcus sp.]|nr:hypothetical protein [Ruminococcus sp.]